MIHIHPFPARMAPEIALKGLENLPHDYVVLDPMSGSGMVLGTAAKLGLSSIGYDLDPLACLISRVNGTFVDEQMLHNACADLLSQCEDVCPSAVHLPWMDNDEETLRYIDYWFAPKQKTQLRALSYMLVASPFTSNKKTIKALKVAVSRLIVTKEPKASLARDTAHSRPHRVITENDFDIFDAMPGSLGHVLKALRPDDVKADVKAYLGDARRMGRIRDCSVDRIVTSPPYLNAIDYMRGHRLSLVWLGYSVPQLRRIRSRSVGAELADHRRVEGELEEFFCSLHSEVNEAKRSILRRYYRDLCNITFEAFRALRPNRKATYVIGNSRVKGHEIRNSDLLMAAAIRSGFQIRDHVVRDIPENHRYMPLVSSGKSSLSERMRAEHVFVFEKAA